MNSGDTEIHIAEQPACPISFAVDNYVPAEEVKALPQEQRVIAMLNAVVVLPEDESRVSEKLQHINTGSVNYEESSDDLSLKAGSSGVKEFERDNHGFTCSTDYDRTEQTFPDCTVRNRLDSGEFEGSKVYSLTKDNYENIVIYIYGGGWFFGIGDDHVSFCDALVTKLNAKVYIPLYPLAPQATSAETYEMIEDFYREVLKEGKNVYIMGDSAGGNITLGLLYTIKAEGLEKPAKTVLLSPCADMSFSNGAIAELDKTDPVLASYGSRKSAEPWAGKENLKDPKNSAVYADVTGYPDIMIVQGTNEIVYPDTMILYEKLKDAGVNTTLVPGDGLRHVFPVDPIPEKETVLELIREFCAG